MVIWDHEINLHVSFIPFCFNLLAIYAHRHIIFYVSDNSTNITNMLVSIIERIDVIQRYGPFWWR